MKQNLLITITFIFTTLIAAQTQEEKDALEFFWGDHDIYKSSIDIPEKWQNESAVIIYKNENYDFHKFGKNVTYTTSVRKRIKLLDKAAVEEFSEFSYQKRFRSSKGFSFRANGNNIIGVKIIKPDGSEQILDIHKDAVVVDGETKVAIENLEVGDIIDFYAYSIEPFKYAYAFGFDPVEKTLSEEYPIMDYKLFFETENDFFINFNSFNNAPELVEISTDKNNMRRYELTAQNIDKHKYERWFFPLVELPTYKFQVFFARSGKFENQADAFLPKKEDIIKKKVSTEEILDYYELVYPYGNLKYEERFLKDKTFNSDAEKATAIYYFMRHYYLTRFLEAFIVKEAGIVDSPFSVYSDDSRVFNEDLYFMRHYIAIMKDNKITCDVLIGKKRYDGPLDDLLIQKNLDMMIKTNTTPPVYISFLEPHATVNTFNPLLEGVDTYSLSATKWKYDNINRITIPTTSSKINQTKKDITVNISDDFKSFSVNIDVSLTGHEKKTQQYERLIFKDYVDEDYKKYETESFIELVKKNNQDTYRQQLNAVIDKLKETQKETFKIYAQNEYELETLEDYNYNIIETGRYDFEAPFTYTEEYTIKDNLIKKAGSNYIIEIGKFIGGQIDLTAEERKRVENIYMEYPRSYKYQINLKIPDGYTVSGLEKLNKAVDNKTGSFISTAVLEGSTLTINTFKDYKNNYESNTDWHLMIDFLDEAHQFTNEKILLKKN